MVGTEDRQSAGFGDFTAPRQYLPIYLHYSFDLWVNVWRKKYAQGEVVVLRMRMRSSWDFSIKRMQTAFWRISGND